MAAKDKFPQYLLIVSAIIITITVIVAGHFDSPEYNDNVHVNNSVVSVNSSLSDVVFIPESGKVDINNATLEELMALEQIGEVRAQAIIDYRNNNLGFYSVDDIMLVNEIPSAVFEKIKDKLTVGAYTEVSTDEF